MAAELPYVSDPSHKPAAAPAAATATTRRVSWDTVAILVFLTVNTALFVRHALLDGDRGGVAFLVFAYLNLVLLVYALRHGTAAPHGSYPARCRAKLAVWLLTTTLTAAFMWRIGEVLAPVPLGLAVAGWVVAAAHVGGGFYVLVLRDDEKPSAALIVRDCEKEGGDLAS